MLPSCKTKRLLAAWKVKIEMFRRNISAYIPEWKKNTLLLHTCDNVIQCALIRNQLYRSEWFEQKYHFSLRYSLCFTAWTEFREPTSVELGFFVCVLFVFVSGVGANFSLTIKPSNQTRHSLHIQLVTLHFTSLSVLFFCSPICVQFYLAHQTIQHEEIFFGSYLYHYYIELFPNVERSRSPETVRQHLFGIMFFSLLKLTLLLFPVLFFINLRSFDFHVFAAISTVNLQCLPFHVRCINVAFRLLYTSTQAHTMQKFLSLSKLYGRYKI